MKKEFASKTALPSILRLIIYILIISGLCLLSYIVAGANDDSYPLQDNQSDLIENELEQVLQDID